MCVLVQLCFFEQKWAYEMRMSDWSSEVGSSDLGAPIAVLLHPHPLHGGTMNNRVVLNMFHAFTRRGFSVLRFNFRGVGRSQGRFARGEGELADAAAALDWLQAVNTDAPVAWVGGFSFGAWIGMQLLMRRSEEHTSELQSLMRISYAVFCLKKKKT